MIFCLFVGLDSIDFFQELFGKGFNLRLVKKFLVVWNIDVVLKC